MDRRKRRTTQVGLAIRYQLDQIAKEINAIALFVADADGLLLGAAASTLDSEVMAAYAPLTGLCPGQNRTIPLGGSDSRSITYNLFEVGGDRLVLGAVTGVSPTLREQIGLTRAITGVRRILLESEKRVEAGQA